MNRASAIFILISITALVGAGISVQAAGKTGEALFKEHCTVCHPDGGNIINPKKTLHKKDREANGVKSEEDVIRLMRKPGAGMTPFDAKILSDNDAKEIAQYILKTFNK
jgi:cytochrome c6